MDVAGADLEMLRLRLAGISARLDGDWAAKLDAQSHLDHETTECAYWHAGYYQALADILNLVSEPRRTTSDIVGTSSPSLAVGRGEGNFHLA
jgi:hypothetical protein